MISHLRTLVLAATLLLASATTFAQTIVSVQPDSANRGQTLEVTITGQNTHFQASSGTIVVQFTQGSSTMLLEGRIQSLTVLKGTMQVPLSAPLGIWNTVVNDYIDPVMTLPNSFRVATDLLPAITGSTPILALQGQSIHIVMTFVGTNFTLGSSAAVWFTQGDLTINATNVHATNPITIGADVTIPVSVSGVWSLHVLCPGLPEFVRPDCFTVYLANAHIVSIDPVTVIPGHVVPITIDFANTSFVVGGPHYWATFWRSYHSLDVELTPVSSTQLQGNLAVPIYAEMGAYSLYFTDNIHPAMELENCLTVIPDPTPVLTTISPGKAFVGDTLSVLIAGRNNMFMAAPGLISLSLGADTLSPLSVIVYSVDSLAAVFAIPPDAVQGMWDIRVDSPVQDPVAYPARFEIYGPPVLVSVDPAEIRVGGQAQLTIICQNVYFRVPGFYSPVIFSREDDTILVASGPTSPTSLLAFMVVPADAAEGYWDISVRYDSVHAVTLPAGFRIYSDCGDVDGSQQTNVADAVYLINYIFAGGPKPVDRRVGDIDCSGRLNISDAVYMIQYIFGSGNVPCSACQ